MQENSSFATFPLIWSFIFMGVPLVIFYYWKSRHLYYYAFKIPGPFPLPFLGHLLPFIFNKDRLRTITKIINSQPSVFKLWLGPYLHVVTTRHQDAQIVLNTCLEKGTLFEILADEMKNSIAGAPLHIWKKNRKLMNPSFNQKVLDQFHDVYVKYTKEIVTDLNELCDEEQTDLMMKLWKHTVSIAHETLFDVDPALIKNSDQLLVWAARSEDIMQQRLENIFLYLEPIWSRSTLGKEAKDISVKVNNYLELLIATKWKEHNQNFSSGLDEKILLNTLVGAVAENGQITTKQIVNELAFMTTAASDTAAIAITAAILALGLYPDIQEKAYQEVMSIIGGGYENFTLENINKLDYLERVIKETLRLFPPAPLIVRHVSENIYLDPYVFPKESDVIISVLHIHRNPELWPNPLKFDPDRFLPEETEKRPRSAFIPFSLGPRNCIGYKYAMMEMKYIFADIVRHFKFRTLKYKSLDEVEIEFFVLAKPKGYSVMLEKRMG